MIYTLARPLVLSSSTAPTTLDDNKETNLVIRNLLVLLGSIILSVLLFALGGWFSLRFSVMGKIVAESAALGHMMDGKEVVAKFGDPFKSMAKAMMIIQYAIFTAGSILIGMYVGVLSKTKEMLISLVSMMPFVTIYGSSESSRLTAFALGVLYIGLCCLGTYIVAMGRTRWGKVAKDPSNNAAPLDERVSG